MIVGWDYEALIGIVFSGRERHAAEYSCKKENERSCKNMDRNDRDHAFLFCGMSGKKNNGRGRNKGSYKH